MTLRGSKTRIILPIKYIVWLKHSKILYFIKNLWGVNLAFPKNKHIVFDNSEYNQKSFHVSKLWQSEWQLTIFLF